MNSQCEMSWSRLQAEAASAEHMTSFARVYAGEGWKRLADAMGPDWLSSAVQEGHPWVGNFDNRAPWVKMYYGRIGHQIALLSDRPGFDMILSRLKDRQTCVSAQAELNAAYKLAGAGMPVEFIQPSPRAKSCDLKTTVDRREVYVEVATLEQSQTSMIQMDIFTRISISLMNPKIESAGIIYRQLSRPHASDIVARTERGIEEALTTDSVVSIDEEGVVAICIAPKHRKSEVIRWKQEHGLDISAHMTAPAFLGSSGRRLHAKIQEKCRQIPENSTGVIYIEGIFVYLTDKAPRVTLDFTKAEVEEAVYECPKTLFVVLNKYYMDWGRSFSLEENGIRFSKRVYHGVLGDVSMAVLNRFCSSPRIRHGRLLKAFLMAPL